MYILTIVLATLIVANAVFIVKFPKQTDDFISAEIASTADIYVQSVSEPSYLPVLVSNENRPVLSAKSAAAYDTRSGRFLFAQNTRTRLPIASLTKIMTSVVVLDHLNPDDVVVVPAEATKVDGEKQTLYQGEKISVLSLMKLLLIESSNDASHALASYFQKKTGNAYEARFNG